MSLTLCSSQNTGSSGESHFSIYQSTGSCSDSCSGYSFAIVLYETCYCSNYAPASTVSLSECNTPCPGYPDNSCGNSDQNLYGYIQLANASGTMSASASSSKTSSSSSTHSSSAATSSSASSSSASSASTSSSSSSLSSSSASSSQSSSLSLSSASSSRTSSSVTSASLSSSTTSSSSNTPTTFAVSVITVTGEGQTQTITQPANTASPSASTAATVADSNKSSGYWDNKGKVAGTFVPVAIVAAALIFFLLFWCCRRRRREQEFEAEKPGSPHTPGSSGSRKMSVLGFKSGTAPPSPIALKRDGSTSKTLNEMGDHIVVDQRLDPSRVYMQFEENDSRFSLQDDRDYSRRVLRIANPDA